jgi:hypothetical protein
MKQLDKPYDIYEHVHRFASWAASTGARQGNHRLKGEAGLKIIEGAGLDEVLKGGTKSLPDKNCADKWHREWRKKIVRNARIQGLTFSHGVAAKLINVYLKAGFVTIANKNDKKVGALHPPVDAAVLDGLRAGDQDFPRGLKWSKLTSGEYEAVIDKIRIQLGSEKRLWMIERHFRGYRA